MGLKIKIFVYFAVFVISGLFSQIAGLGNNQSEYLGQKLPGDIPVVFASGIISTKKDETSFFMSPDGSEFYVCSDYIKLLVVKKDLKIGKWSKPAEVSFGGKYFKIGEASMSPDGNTIYFNCRKSVPGTKSGLTLWSAKRSGNSWGAAISVGAPLNGETMHAVDIASDGSLFASGLKYSKFQNNKYEKPVRIGIKGGHPFIARNGKYLLFGGKARKGNRKDILISYKENDSWSSPKNLGYPVNTKVGETNAYVSPDEKYLFFTRKADIYWVKFRK